MKKIVYTVKYYDPCEHEDRCYCQQPIVECICITREEAERQLNNVYDGFIEEYELKG